MDQLDKNGLTEAEYLARYDASMFPHPSVTADFALICGGALLLVKRGGHPCLGMWALPGGFSEPGEDLRQTAIRELSEETGAAGAEPCLIGIYSRPGRDPRGWTMSGLFAAVLDEEPAVEAADDARDARWFRMAHEVHGDCMTLTLTSGDIRLDAKIRLTHHVTPFGCDITTEPISASGIAFDHAEMIAHVIAKLEKL